MKFLRDVLPFFDFITSPAIIPALPYTTLPYPIRPYSPLSYPILSYSILSYCIVLYSICSFSLLLFFSLDFLLFLHFISSSLPALGTPTRPTSATNFNSSFSHLFSPPWGGFALDFSPKNHIMQYMIKLI